MSLIKQFFRDAAVGWQPTETSLNSYPPLFFTADFVVIRSLQVSNEGTYFSSAGPYFYIHLTPSVSSVTVANANPAAIHYDSGNQVVTIAGSNYDIQDQMSCRVNGDVSDID